MLYFLFMMIVSAIAAGIICLLPIETNTRWILCIIAGISIGVFWKSIWNKFFKGRFGNAP